MSIRISNTLGREREPFVPLVPGRATVYVCGVTTYSQSHIGHGRAAVVFDVVARHLRRRGFAVTYARNYTDVDDKIIRRAAQEGVDPAALAERYVRATQQDFLDLGCLPPDVEPRVTTHIPQIISFVERLISAGKAYAASNGDVYFSVASFAGYGKLSGKKVDELIAGARVDVVEEKHSPADFALWKAAKPGEPSWESPWGPGRPGWHIECSAMCAEHLGQSIDIHGGGADLIFPHHENEIAQSESLTGHSLARYWMHNGMITIDREKMSKSIGNVLNIRDVLERYHREALRLFYLSTHYRSPIDYSATSLEEAEVALERLYQAAVIATAGVARDAALAASVEDTLGALGTDPARLAPAVDALLAGLPKKGLSEAESALADVCRTAVLRFDEGLDDDFNSARALGILFEVAREVRRFGTSHKKPTTSSPRLLGAAALLLRGLGPGGLGLLAEPLDRFQVDLNLRRLQGRAVTAAEIEDLISARRAARERRDWAEADRIRDVLKGHGVCLEDAPERTIWRVEAQAGASPAEEPSC